MAAQGHKLLAIIEVSQSDLQRGAAELAHTFSPNARAIRLSRYELAQEWESKSAHSLAEALYLDFRANFGGKSQRTLPS